MAYDASKLTRLAGASGVSLWHYTTADAMTVVRASGYFNASANMLKVNDVIITITATGGTPAVQLTYVVSNNGTIVDVVDGLVVPVTNT